jgi:AraC-like DNA-binding protein
MSVAQIIPVSVPGLRVVRTTIDGLRVGMKQHHVVSRTERGLSEWWAQGKVWSSGPGSIQLKQPGDVHRDLAHDGPITLQLVILPEHDVARARAEARVAALPHLEPGDPRGLAFHRLHAAVDAGADRLSLEVALTEAIGAFTALRGTAPDHTRPVRRAMDHLREHLRDAITLDDLGRHAGLDKFHLCRAFRAQVGMPPHAYLTELRIARAQELLKRGVRASEVAPQVGLYDQSQLNRHFRRIVGTTPARYASGQSSARPRWRMAERTARAEATAESGLQKR